MYLTRVHITIHRCNIFVILNTRLTTNTSNVYLKTLFTYRRCYSIPYETLWITWFK